MENTGSALLVGGQTGKYFSGHIRDVKLFNRELTSTEIAELARGNDLGFADEFGGAYGGVKTYDFSAGTDGLAVSNGTAAGNIDAIGGKDDNLRFTVNTATSAHILYQNAIFTAGKRYRVVAQIYVPSANSDMDGLVISTVASSSPSARIADGVSVTPDTWVTITGEAIAQSDYLYIFGMYGENGTFTDAGGDDVFYIRNVTVTEIGTLADFRSERYDTSTNKLYCLSDNAFVGTGTSVSLTGREVPVYTTGTWTPTITFGGGSTGVTYSQQEGNYTRIGRIVYVSGYFVLTSKGTDTGSAKIAGLPFTAVNLGAQTESFVVNRTANMASLTSAITGNVDDNASTFALYDHGAAGSTAVDDTNFTDTSVIRFSGTYQIQ